MSNDTDSFGRTLGGPQPQHHGGQRVTRSAARRMLAGTPHGRDHVDLVALLAAVSAPPQPQERTAPGLEEALREFEAGAGTDAGAEPESTADGERPRAPRGSRGLTVRLAATVVLVSGVGAAVAGAGKLPAPMQRLAHEFLGGVGVPAPSAAGTEDGSATPSAAPAPEPAQTGSGSGPASANASSSALVVLCQTVALDGKSWRKDVDTEDRAMLSAAAGGEGKVAEYCETLLAESSPAANDGGRATHTPPANPHSTKH